MKRKLFSLLLALILAVSPLAALGEGMPQIDLDLSGMSSLIVFSQVAAMMEDPSQYEGKVVRVSGYYDYIDDLYTNNLYHLCMIADVTACCAQGLEFVPKEGVELPEPGSNVTVTGRFEIYYEDQDMYVHLVDADILCSD